MKKSFIEVRDGDSGLKFFAECGDDGIPLDERGKQFGFTDFNKEDFEKFREYKVNRVKEIKEVVNNLNKAIEQEKDEINKIKLEFYRDELLMDLREDEDLIKYDGKVPKHIDERAKKKCRKTYDRWQRRLGSKENFLTVKEDVDVIFRNKISYEVSSSTGSGKMGVIR